MLINTEGLAYREKDKLGKYDKAEFIWGVSKDKKAMADKELRSQRQASVEEALKSRYGDEEDPFIRKFTEDKVEFEHGGKHLGAKYVIANGEVEIGADYEVDLLPTLKRPQ